MCKVSENFGPSIECLDINIEAEMYISMAPKVSLLPKTEGLGSIKRPHPNEVCDVCGGIGHVASECDHRIPSIESMQWSIDDDISEIISRFRTDKYFAHDDLGLYLSCPDEPGHHNFENSQFCLNCGREGHNYRHCQETCFEKISSIIRYFPLDISIGDSEQMELLFRQIFGVG